MKFLNDLQDTSKWVFSEKNTISSPPFVSTWIYITANFSLKAARLGKLSQRNF